MIPVISPHAFVIIRHKTEELTRNKNTTSLENGLNWSHMIQLFHASVNI